MSTSCTLTINPLLITMLCLATEHIVTARDDGKLAIKQYAKTEASDEFIPQRPRRQLPPHEVCYRNAKIYALMTVLLIAAHIFNPPGALSPFSGELVWALMTGIMCRLELNDARQLYGMHYNEIIWNTDARGDRAQQQRLELLEDPDPWVDGMLYNEYLEEVRAGNPIVVDRTFGEFVRATLQLYEPRPPLYQPRMTGQERRLMPPPYAETIATQERRPVVLPTYEQALLLPNNEENVPPPPYEPPALGNGRLVAAPPDQQDLEASNEHIGLPTSYGYSDGLRRRNIPRMDYTE